MRYLRVLVGLFVGIGTFAMAVPASAASTVGSLVAVDCLSATNCYAVGNVSGNKPLIKHWNGSAWAAVTVAKPAGTTQNALHGISCPTTTSCFAVGASSTATTNPALVMRRNGAVWETVTAPAPNVNPGALLGWGLNGIACATATSCVAVGSVATTSGDKPFAQRWNGTGWSNMAMPAVTGSVSLNAVSCVAPTKCFAVGRRFAASVGKSWIAHLNGTKWTIAPSPNPSGAKGVNLNGVACVAANNCWAAGSNVDDGIEQSIVERWNGTKWSIVGTSFPAKSILSAVSCAGATNCIVVGTQRSGSNPKTLAARWNGSSWTTTATPNRAGSDANILNGVSCPTGKNCQAVGDDIDGGTNRTLTQRWNGTKWSFS